MTRTPREAERQAVRGRLFASVFVLAGRLAVRSDAELAAVGLTTRQWLLLAVLDTFFADAAPTLSEAAVRYGSSRQNVKTIAEGLAARGWVRLERDPHDRRATRVHLTDAVQTLREPAMQARGAALLDAVLDGLTDDDVRDLDALVGRWLARLDTAPATQE